jgi:hypothetical protein
MSRPVAELATVWSFASFRPAQLSCVTRVVTVGTLAVTEPVIGEK